MFGIKGLLIEEKDLERYAINTAKLTKELLEVENCELTLVNFLERFDMLVREDFANLNEREIETIVYRPKQNEEVVFIHSAKELLKVIDQKYDTKSLYTNLSDATLSEIGNEAEERMKLCGIEVVVLDEDDFWYFANDIFMEAQEVFLFNGIKPTFEKFKKYIKSRVEEEFSHITKQGINYVAYLPAKNKIELLSNSNELMYLIESKIDLDFVHGELFVAWFIEEKFQF